mmetsp:Transcript_51199/g.128562  ORF Transcript_51199/g.128562 Transcript_51199/m.128562 type:complete len:188 (+) Transcript_51199:814-1377(+)
MNEMFCRGLASMDRKASVNRVDTMASHALTQGGVHIRLGGSLHTEGGRGVSQAVSQAGSQWVSECDGLYTQPRTRRKSAQMHPPIHPSIHPSIHSRKHALIAMTRSDPHATIMSPPHIICQKKEKHMDGMGCNHETGTRKTAHAYGSPPSLYVRVPRCVGSLKIHTRTLSSAAVAHPSIHPLAHAGR